MTKLYIVQVAMLENYLFKRSRLGLEARRSCVGAGA